MDIHMVKLLALCYGLGHWHGLRLRPGLKLKLKPGLGLKLKLKLVLGLGHAPFLVVLVHQCAFTFRFALVCSVIHSCSLVLLHPLVMFYLDVSTQDQHYVQF